MTRLEEIEARLQRHLESNKARGWPDLQSDTDIGWLCKRLHQAEKIVEATDAVKEYKEWAKINCSEPIAYISIADEQLFDAVDAYRKEEA